MQFRILALTLTFTFVAQAVLAQHPLPPTQDTSLDQVRMLVPMSGRVKEADVILHFEQNSLRITDRKGAELKRFAYGEIKSAEYTYRDRVAFPPVIRVGSRVQRKHWLTIKTSNDYVVLRLAQENYKVILAALETKSKLEVKVMGETKFVDKLAGAVHPD